MATCPEVWRPTSATSGSRSCCSARCWKQPILFRWFGQVVSRPRRAAATPARGPVALLPVYRLAALLLVVSGYFAAGLPASTNSGSFTATCRRACAVFVRSAAGAFRRHSHARHRADRRAVADPRSVRHEPPLFAVLLLAGGLVVSIACLYRCDVRTGFYPLLAIMLLSLAGAGPRLDKSGVLLRLGIDHAVVLFPDLARGAMPSPMRCAILLFSLVAAFFLLAGFAMMHALSGTTSLVCVPYAGPG